MKIFPLQIIPCGKLLPFLDTDQNYHNSDFVIKFSQTHLTLSISFREQVEPEIYIKRSNNRVGFSFCDKFYLNIIASYQDHHNILHHILECNIV